MSPTRLMPDFFLSIGAPLYTRPADSHTIPIETQRKLHFFWLHQPPFEDSRVDAPIVMGGWRRGCNVLQKQHHLCRQKYYNEFSAKMQAIWQDEFLNRDLNRKGAKNAKKSYFEPQSAGKICRGDPMWSPEKMPTQVVFALTLNPSPKGEGLPALLVFFTPSP
jgi:hypothetical protein